MPLRRSLPPLPRWKWSLARLQPDEAQTMGVGMPMIAAYEIQEQFSPPVAIMPNGFNNAILLPIITVISLFVLGLLLWVHRSLSAVPRTPIRRRRRTTR
jgi:hypothetical protein